MDIFLPDPLAKYLLHQSPPGSCGSPQRGSIKYFWEDASCWLLTSLLVQMAWQAAMDNSPVVFLGTAGEISSKHGQMLEAFRQPDRPPVYRKVTYTEEVITFLEDWEPEPGSFIFLDGISRLNTSKTPRKGDPERGSLEDLQYLNRIEGYETKALLALMMKFQLLKDTYGVNIIISGHQLDRHIHDTYGLGMSPDRNPAVFSNCDMVWELVLFDKVFSKYQLIPLRGFPFGFTPPMLAYSYMEQQFYLVSLGKGDGRGAITMPLRTSFIPLSSTDYQKECD